MKQGELAEALGISKSYLSELERGEKKVSLEVLNKYADTFDVPASTFLSFMEALDGESQARRARARKLLSVLSWTVGNEQTAHEERDVHTQAS
jgi:transcriptional regulator with XRE-family HTH domain